MDLVSLKSDAGIIRDASQSQENTAFRVGSWLVNLIEFLTKTTVEAVITSIIPAVNADGIVLTINYQKADGSTFYNTITLPIADVTKSGLMSPEMVNKIAAMQSSINAINAINADQSARIEALENTTATHRNSIENINEKNLTQDNSISVLQGDISEIKEKDKAQDSRIENNEQILEEVSANAELALSEAQGNKSTLSELQKDVSNNGSDIVAMQASIVKAANDISEILTRMNTQDVNILNLSEYIGSVEQICNERQDVFDTQIANILQRISTLENNNH